MCTELLPPGGYPIAVKYVIYHIIETTLNAGRSGARIPSRAGYFSLPKSSEPAMGLYGAFLPEKKTAGA